MQTRLSLCPSGVLGTHSNKPNPLNGSIVVRIPCLSFGGVWRVACGVLVFTNPSIPTRYIIKRHNLRENSSGYCLCVPAAVPESSSANTKSGRSRFHIEPVASAASACNISQKYRHVVHVLEVRACVFVCMPLCLCVTEADNTGFRIES